METETAPSSEDALLYQDVGDAIPTLLMEDCVTERVVLPQSEPTVLEAAFWKLGETV